jgi:enoyl-CoA hydratase/carnithine racemase
MEHQVLARSVNGVGRLTFNRPEQRNAMSPQMLALFHERLKELDGDREIRCIVIDGAGGNFIAGGDIKAWGRLQGMSPSERSEDFRARLNAALPAARLLDSIEKPLIAAVRGYSIGAGLSFVLAADFVIADQTAAFVFGHIRMGLVPDMGLTYHRQDWRLYKGAGSMTANGWRTVMRSPNPSATSTLDQVPIGPSNPSWPNRAAACARVLHPNLSTTLSR